jgi:hypothetical protein
MDREPRILLNVGEMKISLFLLRVQRLSQHGPGRNLKHKAYPCLLAYWEGRLIKVNKDIMK